MIAPMIAVRWSLGNAAARNALRGATSMDCEHERRIRKVSERGRPLGTGISERAIADGRCVKTIVCIISIIRTS